MNYSALSHHVAAEIRAEMARQRMSLAELAGRIGLSESTLRRRLDGRTPFGLDEFARTAAALNVPVEQLMPPGTDAA